MGRGQGAEMVVEATKLPDHVLEVSMEIVTSIKHFQQIPDELKLIFVVFLGCFCLPRVARPQKLLTGV